MTEQGQHDGIDGDRPAPIIPTGDPSELARSSAVVGVATLLSRVLGLLRDVVLANLIGASSNADAFFVAFKIPNFLRRLFAEGAFAQAFVPVLAQTREQGGTAAVRELIDRVAGLLGLDGDGLSFGRHAICTRFSA
jgi:putative peptidoglycan lipid II flippase